MVGGVQPRHQGQFHLWTEGRRGGPGRDMGSIELGHSAPRIYTLENTEHCRLQKPAGDEEVL